MTWPQWHSHTTKIANKICKIIVIRNKLKHILPQQILSTMYTSLITPHVNYGILLWGHEATRIYKLQKKAIRTISKSKYNVHTEPIFKKLQFLKLNDIFKLQQLKLYYKLIKGDLPKYFQHFSYIHNFEIHHHYTRETSSIFIPRVNHAYAQKHIRHNLIQTINNTPNNILIKSIHIVCAVSSITLKYLFYWNGQLVWTPALALYLCVGEARTVSSGIYRPPQVIPAYPPGGDTSFGNGIYRPPLNG